MTDTIYSVLCSCGVFLITFGPILILSVVVAKNGGRVMRWQLGTRDTGGGFGEPVAEFFESGETVPFATHSLQSLADWLVSTQDALTARTIQYERARREADEWRLAMLRTGNVEVGQ